MDSETRVAMLIDSAFLSGMKLGWNLCDAGKDAEFVRISEQRSALIAEAAKETGNEDECKHEWVDGSNKYVSNVYVCLRCKTIGFDKQPPKEDGDE